MIKGILFDFNGTLFYDSDKHIAAFQKFFEKRGLQKPSEEYIVKNIFGRTNRTIFSEQYRADAADEELDAYGREKEELYREACLEDMESFHLAEGAEEFLDYLKEKGIPYNLATGSDIDNVSFYFERMGIGRWFDIDRIVYNDNTLPGKPAPDVYIEAARRIGLTPAECIVFEDGTSGIKAANSAGAGAVFAVASPELDSPVTDDVRVDGEIYDFKAYISILKKFELA
ncbi:MAG: HAD family phosphatase [Clostridia bacterium]|nr:HAD family phosphatase [Clostridia bacterium]